MAAPVSASAKSVGRTICPRETRRGGPRLLRIHSNKITPRRQADQEPFIGAAVCKNCQAHAREQRIVYTGPAHETPYSAEEQRSPDGRDRAPPITLRPVY